jgi:hypothetical protein
MKRLLRIIQRVALASALMAGFLLASSVAALANPTSHWVNRDDPNGGGYAPQGQVATILAIRLSRPLSLPRLPATTSTSVQARMQSR